VVLHHRRQSNPELEFHWSAPTRCPNPAAAGASDFSGCQCPALVFIRSKGIQPDTRDVQEESLDWLAVLTERERSPRQPIEALIHDSQACHTENQIRGSPHIVKYLFHVHTPPMHLMLAEALSTDSSGLVHQLFLFLIVGICVALIFWVGRWFITKLAAPPAALTIWTGLFVLVGLIVALNFLLGLAGHPFVKW
jgi:lipopolysaccharide export LptBFGC system permease protein LptF